VQIPKSAFQKIKPAGNDIKETIEVLGEHGENKTPILENAIPVLGVKPKRV